MFRPFQLKVGHFTFNYPRVGPQPAWGQTLAANILQQPLVQGRELFWSGHLKFGQGIAQDPDRTDETEPVGIKLSLLGDLVHTGPGAAPLAFFAVLRVAGP